MAIACYAHPTSPTVAQCADCSRGLCVTCEAMLRPPLCAACADARAKVVIGAIYGRLTSFCIWALIGGGIGYWISTFHVPHAFGHLPLRLPNAPPNFGVWLPLGLAYLFGGTVYGRHALVHRNTRGYIMTFSLMVTFGFFLLIAGAVVGLVATPFVMAGDFRLLRRQRILVAAAHRAIGATPPGRVVSARLR